MRGNANRIAAMMLLFCLAAPAVRADERAIRQRVQPTYPEIAKRMKITGVVKMDVTVDASGKVTDAKALSGNRMLSAAAEEAVRKWKFATASGETVEKVDIDFTIAGQ